MSLISRLQELAGAIGTDVKTLTNSIGSLAGLTTTTKTDTVSAINEVKAAADLNTAKTGFTDLTGDVTSVGAATTIAVDAVDIPMISATGTPDASTFLRGDNTWSTPAGSGDVSKVGTPLDNQIGVWTGDGTIEGDTLLEWNGLVLDVTGDIAVSGTVDGIDIATDVAANTAKISATGTELEPGDIDTLAELNAIITDATLIDTADARLSDARTPTAHTHTLADITDSGTLAAKSTVDTADITNLNVTLGKLETTVQTSLGLADTATQPADISGLASTGYVDTAVSNLVDTAPAALDTLNELAAALGDDANFATTTSTALGNRLRFDSAQSLNGTQLTQGQDNLSVYSRTQLGNPDTNLVTSYTAARDAV